MCPVKFRVKAPSSLRAVDVPSKIRFPRLSVPCKNFEPLTDDSVLSFYAVKIDCVQTGIYTFCSFCGVHILYSPSVNPTELLINVECIDKSTIKDLSVTYHSSPETMPSLMSAFEVFKSLNKHGGGHQQQSPTATQFTPHKPENTHNPADFLKPGAGVSWRSSTPSTASCSDPSESGSRSINSSSSSR